MHNSIHIHARRSNVNDYPKDYGSSNISSNSELLGPVFTTRFPGCATHQSQSNGLNATIDQWDRHRLFTLTAHSQYQQYVHTDWGKFACNLRERRTSLYWVFKDWYNSWRQTDDASIYYFFPFSQPVFIASSFLMKESMPYSNNQSMTVNLIKE